MSEDQPARRLSAFRTTVISLLVLAVLLLAGILSLLAYGGYKISTESKTVTNKVNNFNQQVQTINSNLSKINTDLQQLKSSSVSLPAGL